MVKTFLLVKIYETLRVKLMLEHNEQKVQHLLESSDFHLMSTFNSYL